MDGTAAMIQAPSQREGAPPALSPIGSYLTELLERYASCDDGDVATYIPELATADPSLFGIAVATVDGSLYEAGDSRASFTLQSISKPLVHGLAIEVSGLSEVRRRVGVEPSGDAFNEISVDRESGAPRNPMINAGAITCAGIVAERAPDPLQALIATVERYVGRPASIDEAVYRSEAETGHRNRAIAHLLRNANMLTGNPELALELYFKQCAIQIDCRDLAVIGATLANGGVNPDTGERAVRQDIVREMLSVMATCGMYDSAGDWIVSVGLPAKSGVSGGLLAVLPGRLGIGVFSPRLDRRGNSVRGVAVCRDLSRDLALHLVRPGERTPSPLRSARTLAEVASKRLRPLEVRRALAAAAARTAVYEVQGELGFAAVEAIERDLLVRATAVELLVVDLEHVDRIGAGGRDLLLSLAIALEERGGALAVSGVPGEEELDLAALADLDRALEWCEDELLLRLGVTPGPGAIQLRDHPFVAGLEDGELQRVAAAATIVDAGPGELVVRQGSEGANLFLVLGGSLSVVTGVAGETRRHATVSPGMVFGELAYVTRARRSADVRADTAIRCAMLPFDVIDALEDSDPRLCAKLRHNLLAVVTATVRRLDDEVASLSA
jgi:glutaminase